MESCLPGPTPYLAFPSQATRRSTPVYRLLNESEAAIDHSERSTDVPIRSTDSNTIHESRYDGGPTHRAREMGYREHSANEL